MRPGSGIAKKESLMENEVNFSSDFIHLAEWLNGLHCVMSARTDAPGYRLNVKWISKRPWQKKRKRKERKYRKFAGCQMVVLLADVKQTGFRCHRGNRRQRERGGGDGVEVSQILGVAAAAETRRTKANRFANRENGKKTSLSFCENLLWKTQNQDDLIDRITAALQIAKKKGKKTPFVGCFCYWPLQKRDYCDKTILIPLSHTFFPSSSSHRL